MGVWFPLFFLGLALATMLESEIRIRRGHSKPASTQLRDSSFYALVGFAIGSSAGLLSDEALETVLLGIFGLFVVGAWSRFLLWPGRKKRAGAVVVRLKRRLVDYGPGAFAIVFAVFFTLIWLGDIEEGNLDARFLLAAFAIYSICGFLIMVTAVGARIHENGFLTFESFIPWRKIESYAWYPGEEPKLSIRIQRWIPLFFARSHMVWADQREQVDAILARQLGESEVGEAES